MPISGSIINPMAFTFQSLFAMEMPVILLFPLFDWN